MVLGCRHQPEVDPVAEGQDRHLRADEALLEQHPGTGIAELPVRQHRSDRLGGFGVGGSDDHALARGEPAGLHHRGLRECLEVSERRLGIVEGGGLPCRDPVPNEECLAVRLRTLELGRRGRRAEGPDADLGEPVDQAADERILRSDHHHHRIEAAGQSHQTIEVVGRHGLVATPGLRGRAGVARGDHDLVDAGRPGQLPGQRVLSSSTPDHQHGPGHRQSPQT
ncbi:MAG: hypothetical protein R2695_12135 [Acidimicrobiales bacterium]